MPEIPSRLRGAPRHWIGVLVLLLGVLPAGGSIAQAPGVPGGGPVNAKIASIAADAVRDATLVPSDASFQIRNYTDEDIKTCFYNEDDDVMLIPLPIREDRDDCYSTPKAGKKKYRTDTVKWSKFKARKGDHPTLHRRINARIFKKNRIGTWKRWCKRKGIVQPDQLRILKDGKGCKTVVVRTYEPKYLKASGVTNRDVLRWNEAHVEDINYIVARNADYVMVGIRGTSNYQNRKMNGELTEEEAKSQADVRESRLSGRAVFRNPAMKHYGWDKVTNKIYDQIEPYLLDWAGKEGEKREIIVTGHSMGGAVATYLAEKMMRFGWKNVHLVTFGSPRVTTRSFVEEFNTQARGRLGSATFIERPDDPRLDDWTSKVGSSAAVAIVGPEEYSGLHVEFPAGCADPHSGQNYAKQAKDPSFVCTPAGNERRRAGQPDAGEGETREQGEPPTRRRGDRRGRPRR